ncbi:MAG: MurR/RpiR family transcriptional regulator [Streptococcaceae bacterium]|jgi:RpiR family glv operon transcriptional regulator|nr:MurR/RpiR family transcriptional regulator [Streptococcaceae bacterium]
MNNLFSDLYSKYSTSMSKSEKEIFKLLLENIEVIPNSTINELATSIYISSSSLYRLVRKLGFQGYSDFKYHVTNSLKTEKIISDVTEEFLEGTINEIKYTHKINQQNLPNAAKLLLEKKERYVYGTGWKQKQLVDNFASDMMLYGIHFTNIRNSDDLKVAASNMGEDSVLILASLKGEGLDYQEALDILELRNISIVSITSNTANRLSTQSDVALYYADNHVFEANTHWRAISLLYALNSLVQAVIVEKEKL